jgi:hypothetical protein
MWRLAPWQQLSGGVPRKLSAGKKKGPPKRADPDWAI